ncbi:hypothetical protein HOP50_02g19510 [Chloropicon primus]|uniref:RmlD-like substrate binding domain-containing protein n=1 Tax=Chloropicon primus TaxID=1764295 RepID=A0A5B8MG58_9CHLO|nr:hypothetical protein A3770_02p19540 [Chloropicon primus]UPQ98645.1 hypothetical protein HOP50_02g19510 [Chloropicon primus]|mmetsp:Transcript_11741/g.32500  ORF Transcript_11741/g.32500 Transcript_11741/m.32500 type:complete len:591 (+) Transcript_11741:98-1870(+)|eukprot:QDZ19436.1 hypothetical protein A3770_02p19540 [Chloropicon primus]
MEDDPPQSISTTERSVVLSEAGEGEEGMNLRRACEMRIRPDDPPAGLEADSEVSSLAKATKNLGEGAEGERTSGESVEIRDSVLKGDWHPGAGSSKSLLPDFTGHWRVRDVENLDPLLAAAGAPWIVRKLLYRSFSKARMKIVQKKSVLHVEDKSIPKDRKTGSMLTFVEGVDNHRKDSWGFKILERCKWTFDTDLERFVWSLETHGYHDGKFGPIVSRYYFDKDERDVLVSEVSFNNETMMRKWVHDLPEGEVTRRASEVTAQRKQEVLEPASKGEEESTVASRQSMAERPTKVLLYGKGGWMACQIGQILVRMDIDFEFGAARLENYDAILKDVMEVNPTHIINAAGRVGQGEGFDPAMVASNLSGAMNLAAIALERGCHLTHLSELDADASFYSWTKEKAHEMLDKKFKNRVLILRIGIALNADLKHPDSGFARLRRRAEQGEPLTHTPRFVSCLPELLPLAVNMIKERQCGVVNLVNPGRISETRLFVLYKRFVLPHLTWETSETSEEIQYISAKGPTPGLGLAKMLHAEESLHEFVFAPNSPDQDEVPRGLGFCGLGSCGLGSTFCGIYDSCQTLSHVSLSYAEE